MSRHLALPPAGPAKARPKRRAQGRWAMLVDTVPVYLGAVFLLGGASLALIISSIEWNPL